MAKNFYQVLGVDADASPEQIQAAYVYWARQIAPNPDAAKTRDLKELQQAYSVLAHPERRRAYNARMQHPTSSPGAEPFRADPTALQPPQTKPSLEISLRESFHSAQPSFEELFDRLWSNFSDLSRPKAERVENLTLEVALTRDQAQAGGVARILIPARALCPVCSGKGALGLYQCWQCEGHGSITADYPFELTYPSGIVNEHLAQVPLSRFGIENFYLTVRFRVSDAA